MKTRLHLDIGCGGQPRNPFGFESLQGVDLSPPPNDPRLHRVNLALQPLPFGDSHFDGVSAYDFLEHMPRVLATPDGLGTRLPFIELMNEVWRVLKPGGVFYASTPVYPSPAAFGDPTHVNFITLATHEYFVRPTLRGAMYGFVGAFRQKAVHLATPTESTLYVPPPSSAWQQWRQALAAWRGRRTHVIWEFEALK